MNHNNFEKGNNQEYQKTIDDLFAQAAARLIAHGDQVDMSGKDEHALFEARAPFSFSANIDPRILSPATPSVERISTAELVFMERRIDSGAGPNDEPLPDSITLMIDSIDIHGQRCESALQLSRGVGEDHATGLYSRMVIGEGLAAFEGHIFNEDYYRDPLTDNDIEQLRRAINSLPPAPGMETIASGR